MLTEMLLLLSLGAVGVYAGAMLMEGAVLVPYWRSLPPAAFFAWYAANDRRLLSFFGPVTALAAALVAVAALSAFAAGHAGRWPALAALLLMALAVAMFPIYFQGANARFAAAQIPPSGLAVELERWSAWHARRTALALAALAAALLAALRG